MASFTCWCGYIIRDNNEPAATGHVLWDDVDGFYEEVAAKLLSFVQARAAGVGHAWIREHFEDSIAPYEMTPAEVAEALVYRTSEGVASGIYRCPVCKRVHIHIRGTANQWQSYLPERASGDT